MLIDKCETAFLSDGRGKPIHTSGINHCLRIGRFYSDLKQFSYER
jgi:hypothetical protein